MDIGAVLGRIGFNLNTFIVTIINFFIIFFILKKFLLGPITKTLDERQESIKNNIKDSQSIKHELSMAEQKANEIIDKSKKSSNDIIEKSKKDAVQLSSTQKKKATEEIVKMKETLYKQLDKDKKTMILDAKKEVADLAILATKKIIDKELDEDQDRKIISDYLNNISKTNE